MGQGSQPTDLSACALTLTTGQYYLPEVEEAGVLFAQELARDCGDRLFCETVTRESIDYNEYVRTCLHGYMFQGEKA